MAFISDEKMQAALNQVKSDNDDFLQQIKDVLSAMEKGSVQAGVKAEAFSTFGKDMLKNGAQPDFTIQYDSKNLNYNAEQAVKAYIKWMTDASSTPEASIGDKRTLVFLDTGTGKIGSVLDDVNRLIKDGKYDAVKVVEFVKQHPDLVSNSKSEGNVAKIDVPQVTNQKSNNVQIG